MSHSPLWDTDLTHFQRIKFEKGKKMMTGKSGTHYINQVMKVHITSNVLWVS